MVKKRIPVKIRKDIDKYIVSLKEDNFSFDKILLFGSWATGRAHEDSDIDLCVVSSNFDKIDPWEYLWRKKADINSLRVQPVGFTPEDFVDESPIVHEIKKYGISVA